MSNSTYSNRKITANIFSGIISAICFLVMLGSLLAGTALFFVNSLQNWEHQTTNWYEITNGNLAHKFEEFYEQNLPYRQFAIGLFGAIRYGLFKTGSNGVVIGNNDWLYTAEEFELSVNYNKYLMHNLNIISAVSSYLQTKNIELITILLPAKARIYSEHLGHIMRPARLDKIYNIAKNHLHNTGHFIDISTAMLASKTNGKLFMERDTHWTPEGARLAAQIISKYIKLQLAADQLTQQQNFVTTLQKTIKYKGDLIDFVPTGFMRPIIGPHDETLHLYNTESRAPNIDLFADTKIEIALIGTSYSARDEWNFAGFLREALSTDILNIADEGSGPMAPMAKFLNEYESSEETNHIRLVIWELPERFLPVDYSDITWPASITSYINGNTENNLIIHTTEPAGDK